MVGIIQEQHPDRCRLFMQWKQMDWPILVDGLNLLDVAAVPITLGIDERGIVRMRMRRPGELQAFLDAAYDKPTTSRAEPEAHIDDLDRRAAMLVMSDKPDGLTRAIEAYEERLPRADDQGRTHFRLGSIYRLRYDSTGRWPDDFQKAVEHWTEALAANPNQYIWRRRIEQYGPLLQKPYAFYDWVEQARTDIRARGEQPAPLRVEPGETELAGRRDFTPDRGAENPDPDGRIDRDTGLILAEATVVPASLAAGAAGRVHVVLRPNEKLKAHWNNEVDRTRLWIDPPAGWSVDRQLVVSSEAPSAAASTETRRLEFELRAPADAKAGEVTIPAYALYYVCEDEDGACLYRRQDIPIRVTVAK
jgi:hypothetical protein